MKYFIFFIFSAVLLFACSNSDIEHRKFSFDTHYSEAKVICSWICNYEELELNKTFSFDTMVLLENYRKLADSIIKDEDIYEIINLVTAPLKFNNMLSQDTILIGQETFTQLQSLDYYYIKGNYNKYVNADDGGYLFMYSQLSCKSFYWDEKKMKYVRCIPTKDLLEIYNYNENTKKFDYEAAKVKFNKKFRGRVYHSYSKPIFNKERNFALIEFDSGFLGGFLILKKINNKWKYIDSQTTWIL